MKSKSIIFVFILQFALIAVMFINAYMVVFFGTEVKVFARGIDPRDLLTGNYVFLEYEFKKDENITKDFSLSSNKKHFYALLKDEDQDGIFTLTLSDKKPTNNELFIISKYATDDIYASKFGIERYFLPKKEAEDLEKKLTKQKALVSLKVFNAQARITNLELVDE
ncbi:GDYXXLXY domain-containing protein [Campylobacter sp. MIT 97-5078]|uniref:GDYXXLXY domain-containing protein n=1 Tax=Campylobacter sp. MIT 97-5078 TaxID=1548153 RepID=UPI000513D7B7|nr:GDYXXLXY domain-containing protein [Campylobacter sp. MIT 97-5078]KGI56793.1 hypothetical protein LR59_04705 [Campylobacter sp. MIT 97-5078]TQR27304.1 hypothetical protein DMB91_04760 [Campylobacter sp. MIT 97-5078]